MAKSKKATKVVDKWKKKKWFKIFASKEFNEECLGETLTSNPSTLIGRTLKVNLMAITGNVQKQNTNVIFEIRDVKGDNALTYVKSFELVPASIKRRIRRDKEKIESSFLCITKDEVLIRLKPLILTNSKATSKAKKSLMKSSFLNVLTLVRTLDYSTLVSDLVSYKFQRALKNTLNKTFPVKSAEIRIMTRVKEDKNKRESITEKINKIMQRKAAEQARETQRQDMRAEKIKEEKVDEVKSEKKEKDAPKEETEYQNK